MAIKVLFFDTSVLLKLFVNEEGTQKIKWLCKSDTRVLHSLHFVINEQVVREFKERIDCFVTKGRLSREKGEHIKSQFFKFYKGKMFCVIGQSIISNTKKETSFEEGLKQLSMKEGKDDWDGYHYQSIVNSLAYLGGKSEPILVTADGRFGNKLGRTGYRVINPLKQSKSEIESIIA